MQKTVPWVYSNHRKWKPTHPSRATTSQTKAWSTVCESHEELRMSTWCFYRIAMLSFFHNAFVFIFVITMATKQRLVVNLELGFVEIIIRRTVIFEHSRWVIFACRILNLLAIDAVCDKNTNRSHVFLMRILAVCLFQIFVTVVQVLTATLSRTDSTHTRLRHNMKRIFVSRPTNVSSPLVMSYTAPLTTPGTCTPSLSWTQSSSPAPHTLLSELQPCAHLRRPLSGALAEPPSLTKKIDVDEPISFLDHVNLGCTQRVCKQNEIIIDPYREMFESPISAGATEKLPVKKKSLTQKLSYDMEGHARKCVERYCELANTKTEQLYKVSSLYLDDHQVKKEELESVGELSDVCSQMVLKSLYLARMGVDQTSLRTVNKLARSVTKMDRCLWEAFKSFDLIHSSHMWIQAILSCG